MSKVPFDRRRVLQALSVGGIAAAADPTTAQAADRRADWKRNEPQVRSTFMTFDDPIKEFEAHFRFERDLQPEQGTAISWYYWTAYIVPENSAPQPIVRFEGMEYSYFRKVAEHTYRIHAHNLSYPRDLQTGKYSDSIVNPVTGKRVKVKNTVLLHDPGTVHSPRGFRNVNGDGSYVVPYRQFRDENGVVKLDSVRTAPPNWPTTHMESSTQTVDRALFYDASVTSLPFRATGLYLFPYPEWIEMGDAKGHMLGFIDGQKIGGPDKLPAEFLARTRREYPELLSPRWGEFDRPAKFSY
jgi:hypothetical protein